MANARRDKNVAFSPLQFLAAQALETAGPDRGWTVVCAHLLVARQPPCGTRQSLGWDISDHLRRHGRGWWSSLLSCARIHGVARGWRRGAGQLDIALARAGVVVIPVIVIAGAIVAPLAAAPTRGDLWRFASGCAGPGTVHRRAARARKATAVLRRHARLARAGGYGRLRIDRCRPKIVRAPASSGGTTARPGRLISLALAMACRAPYRDTTAITCGDQASTGEVMIVIGDDLESLARRCMDT